LILLDTNVVSETMRPVPDARVIAWLNAQSAETIYLSTIFADGLIAALATARDLTVATRDTAPFISAGLRVINLWIVT
jgi:predicted nucleic acid-binding protein